MPPRIVVAAVATMLSTNVVSGCGASEEEQVRATLDRFERVTAERNVNELCDEVISRTLQARMRQVGLSCEQAWRVGLSEVRQPRLEVKTIRVDGDKAEADVRSTARGQKPANVTVELVKEDGGWRIADLGEAGPPTPGG
jgi:hypothetical protein